MPQPRIATCTEIHTDGGQARYNCSPKSWVTQVKNKLDAPDKMWHVSKKVCIYRVPKSISISKPEAYVPMVVSFGPYHYNNNDEFSRMNQHKLEAVSTMLSRLHMDVSTMIENIQKLECEIRECYEEPLDFDGETLSLMLVMDACFILEFLRGESNPNYFSLVFPSVSNSMSGAILNDILKLENQIPLCILIKILELECRTREKSITMLEVRDKSITMLAEMLSNNFLFRGFPFPISMDRNYESKVKIYIKNESPPSHLLDLYRIVIQDLLTNSSAESATPVKHAYHVGAVTPVESADHGGAATPVEHAHHCLDILPCLSPTFADNDTWSTPTAELLHKAGIKFQKGQFRFEKRSFGASTLSLPQITVVDITEVVLRNLIAYEECHSWSWSPNVTVISHFVKLLDDLIDSERDVSILRKSQVIESWIGSDEDIAYMFNHLCDGITVSTTLVESFESVMKEARDHYKSQWKVWMSQFKQEHCSNPWKVLSIVAAILILGMTAVQTLYSVK